MEKILKLNKKMSETPLECIQRWKKENPEYVEEKMTYAGRLDPMAEGELLVLVGEEFIKALTAAKDQKTTRKKKNT